MAGPGDKNSWVLAVEVNEEQVAVTTGFRFFAECLSHSAKANLHSAKPLPSAVFGKEHTAKN